VLLIMAKRVVLFAPERAFRHDQPGSPDSVRGLAALPTGATPCGFVHGGVRSTVAGAIDF